MALIISFIAVFVALAFDVFLKEEKWKKLHIPILSVTILGLYLHANSSNSFTENQSIYWSLGASLLVAALLSFSLPNKNYIIPLLFLGLLAFVPVAIFKKALVSNEFSFSFGWGFALVAFVVALIGYSFPSVLRNLTMRVKQDQKPYFLAICTGILLAVFIYFFFFFFSYGGIFILSVYLFMGSLLSSEQERLSFGTLFFAMGLLPGLWGTDSEQVLDISQGSNLFALLMGLSSVGLYELQTDGRRTKLYSLLIVLLLGSFTFAIWWLGTQKPDLGGPDAIISTLLGVGLGALFTSKRHGGSVLVGIVLTASLCTSYFSESQVDKKGQKTISDTGASQEKEVEKEVKTYPLESLIGNFIFDEKSAEISFELGPKGGRTKGVISNVSGNLELDTKQNKGIVNVDMKVSNLSTFNSYRDESLMEPGYFNVATFPTMTYKARSILKQGEQYYLKGDFNMLGKRKEVLVELRYLGEQKVKGKRYPVLSGGGTIDRTLFGMKPDSKEGNIVDFRLYIPLIKK